MKAIIAIIVIILVYLFFAENPIYLIIVAAAIIGGIIKLVIDAEKAKREKAAELWKKEQEQKDKEHEKYIRELEQRKLLKMEQERQKRLQEYKKSMTEQQCQTLSEKEFTFDEAIDVYLKTNHKSCKSIYDYDTYFSDAFGCILKGMPQCEIELSDEKILRQVEMCNPIEETKNITKATKFEKFRDFIAIDTETTGLKCGGNDIVEICAIKFLNFRPTEKFHSYLKPRKSIPESATAINGITDDMVCDAPKFSQIKSSLQDFIGDLPLVAHNAPFDMKFLHVSGLNLENHIGKVYDTLKLSRLKLRDYDGSKFESYKLSDLCEELNISCSEFHNADTDALACGLLFIEILKSIKEVDSVDDF